MSESRDMEAVLGGVRGRVPTRSRALLVPLAALAAILVAGVGALGYRALSASGGFDVAHVTVSGGSAGTDAAVRAAVAERYGARSLLQIDPGALAAELAAIPRVQSATVDRAFPDTLAVRIVPERPVAIAATASGRVVVAVSGRVVGPAERGTRLPVIAAAPSDIPGVGGGIANPRVLDELQVAARARHGLRVQAIGYGQDGLVARTAAGTEIRFGDGADVGAKLRVARSVMRRADTAVAYVDVSVPAAPAMRQATADPRTEHAAPPTAPVAAGAASAGAWTAGASPAESIRTLFG